MTTYYCKCGRQVKKSSNADNTGNRDTADCTGCPEPQEVTDHVCR